MRQNPPTGVAYLNHFNRKIHPQVCRPRGCGILKSISTEKHIPVYLTPNVETKFIYDAVPDKITRDTLHAESDLKAWPVPFEKSVTFLIESDQDETVDLQVFDENGLEVLSSMKYHTNEIIHLDKELKKGIYFVKARFGNGIG